MVSCLEKDLASLEDLTAVRLAIELCNSNELKKELLCAPGSEYVRSKNRYMYFDPETKWKKILENKTPTILEELGLQRALLEKVTGLVSTIGRKMLTWAKYHEGTLDLSREYSTKFLNSSVFTSHGIIDNKKAADELMKDGSLKPKQKYTLACLYCLTENIPDSFRQMSQKEKENLGQELCYIEIVKFWSDLLTGEIDKLRGWKTLDQYMLEKAIQSGSKATVEYCLEETRRGILQCGKKANIIDAALKTTRITRKTYYFYNWLLFMGYRRVDRWIPADYFVDVLCFLLSKTSGEQKVEILKKDIEDSRRAVLPDRGSSVLNCFLRWPYQNYFIKTANLMWEFLPERTYADLLEKICDKINPRVSLTKHDEDKSYDYRKLLKEFWTLSPDRYKRYVFADKETVYFIGADGILNLYKNLIIVKLFTFKKDTYEDRKIFELILDSTTGEERERIISSDEGKDICIGLVEAQKWEMLGEFLSKCISSREEAKEFKRRLSFSEEARSACANITKCKWNAAESFIKWSSLPEEEVIRFKKELICSEHGSKACWYLYLHQGGEVADRFCDWCFSSKEEIKKFKKELVFSVGVASCADLIMEDKLEVVDQFITWSHLSQEDIKGFKKHLLHEKGNYICENLITGDVSGRISNTTWCMFNSAIQFQGAKWEVVEKFLTWCCSSEEEMGAFKRDRLLKMSGRKIHFCLIEPNRWEEAETFFAWLGLAPKEVKELKRDTLFKHERADKMLRLMMCRRRSNEEWSDYRNRREGIGLVLRWHLPDKEAALEFRDHFKQKYQSRQMTEEARAVFKIFDKAIRQLLSDLDEEQRGLCNAELKSKLEWQSMKKII